MAADDGIVYVVDDDPSIRQAMSSVIPSIGSRVETFGSAKDFLGHQRADAPACLVLDVNLTDGSGLEVPRELEAMNAPLPIIFITG